MTTFQVSTSLGVTAPDARAAVDDFIEWVLKYGLQRLYYQVEDGSGQQWMVSVSEHNPVLMTMEEWSAAQAQMGLGAPDDIDPIDDGDAPEPEDEPEPARRRPARKKAAPHPAPPKETDPIPDDAREAVRRQLARINRPSNGGN